MRTTLAIDDRLLALAKQRARERHLTLGEYVEQAIQVELLRPLPPAMADRPALPTFDGGGLRVGSDPTKNPWHWDDDEVDGHGLFHV